MIGTGWVGSAATHLYLAVPRERRFCTPNTRFLIHQPSGGAGGPASDIAIHAQEIIKARERIAPTIARETGKPWTACCSTSSGPLAVGRGGHRVRPGGRIISARPTSSADPLARRPRPIQQRDQRVEVHWLGQVRVEAGHFGPRLSSPLPKPVTATAKTCSAPGCARIRRSVSNPFMPGMARSISTTPA